MLAILYALGAHTPLFGLMFDWLPGVSAFRRRRRHLPHWRARSHCRRYVVHRFASGTAPEASPRRLMGEAAAVAALLALAGFIAIDAGRLDVAARPLAQAALWIAVAAGALALIRNWAGQPASGRQPCLGVMVADLAANNGPNESTALPPRIYEVLDPKCRNETIALIKRLTRQNTAGARRDRVELAGVGFDWPNLGLIHALTTRWATIRSGWPSSTTRSRA